MKTKKENIDQVVEKKLEAMDPVLKTMAEKRVVQKQSDEWDQRFEAEYERLKEGAEAALYKQVESASAD
jgi:hypothetical protein